MRRKMTERERERENEWTGRFEIWEREKTRKYFDLKGVDGQRNISVCVCVCERERERERERGKKSTNICTGKTVKENRVFVHKRERERERELENKE